MPIIEEFMRRAMRRPRWCPHNRHAARAMTKFKGAHSEPLFNLLRTELYTLKGEKNELADRASQRQTGTVPRHKVSAIKTATERTFFVLTSPGMRISFWCTRGRCREDYCLCCPVFVLALCVVRGSFRLEGPPSVTFIDAIALP